MNSLGGLSSTHLLTQQNRVDQRTTMTTMSQNLKRYFTEHPPTQLSDLEDIRKKVQDECTSKGIVYGDFIEFCYELSQKATSFSASETDQLIHHFLQDEKQNLEDHLSHFSQGHRFFGTGEGFQQSNESGLLTFTDPTTGGQARRDSVCSGLWHPLKTGEQDKQAALIAARKVTEQKVASFAKKQKPGMMAFCQDSQGRVVGGFSVRGESQDRFEATMGIQQQAVLAQIPTDQRGKGHGYCAEQPVTHNARNAAVSGKFDISSPCTMTAIGTGNREGVETEACKSCRHTNVSFGMVDSVVQGPSLTPQPLQSPISDGQSTKASSSSQSFRYQGLNRIKSSSSQSAQPSSTRAGHVRKEESSSQPFKYRGINQ